MSSKSSTKLQNCLGNCLMSDFCLHVYLNVTSASHVKIIFKNVLTGTLVLGTFQPVKQFKKLSQVSMPFGEPKYNKNLVTSNGQFYFRTFMYIYF